MSIPSVIWLPNEVNIDTGRVTTRPVGRSTANGRNQNLPRALERLERDGYIERLERDGYTERARSPEGARRRVVALTPAESAIWEKANHPEANRCPPAPETGELRRALREIIAASPAQRW